MHPIDTHTSKLQDGYSIRILIYDDNDGDAPWERSEGHGPVSDWESRDKRPGEWILNSDRGSKRFYDAAEAIRIAKRDGWGLAPDAITELVTKLKKEDSSQLTKGEMITEAVRHDFEFLRGWCQDEWHYIGYTAELIHEDDEGAIEVINKLFASCWGFESTKEGRAYMLEVATSEATSEAQDFLESIAEMESAVDVE
jgi:hypothetical protein